MLGIFLDTETNGLNPYKHRILEIAFRVIDLLSGETLQSYNEVVSHSEEVWEKSNPKSLAVNGFTREMIEEGKPEEIIVEEIIELFHKNKLLRRKISAFICQNPSFDRVFFSQLIPPERQDRLGWPYHWLDLASMFWSVSLEKNQYPWDIGLSKDAIASHYHLPLEGLPHRAMQGVDHLLLCYKTFVGFPQAVG